MTDLEIVISNIEATALQLNKDPWEVTKADYIKCGFKEWGLRKLGGISSILRDNYPSETSKNLSEYRGSIRRKQYVTKLENQVGDDTYWNNRWKFALSDALKANPIILHKPRKIDAPKKNKLDRYVIGHLSDNHWGGYIDAEEVEGNEYTWQIAARRTGMFVDTLANYKLDHRNECGGLVLNIGGDQIEGILDHNQEWANQDMLTWQMIGATRYIISSIDYLLNFYPEIIIPATTDNHMRVQTGVKGRDKAKRQRYDSMLTQMMEGLRQVFRHEPRVRFIQPLFPYTMYRLFDWNYLLVHGDAVITFGNVHNTVPIADITRQVNAFNAIRKDGDRADVVFGGHVHFGLHAWLSNGVRLFINPSMSGIDPYGNFLGGFKDPIGQWIVEATRDNAVGDMRLADLSQADKYVEYEKIIPPFNYSLNKIQTI